MAHPCEVVERRVGGGGGGRPVFSTHEEHLPRTGALGAAEAREPVLPSGVDGDRRRSKSFADKI